MSSSTTRLIASVATVAALTTSAFVGAGPTAQAAPQAKKPHKSPATKVAYLTFDDGPTATYTPQVLSILRQHRAKATFFMIGRQAAARPSIVRQVRAEGHAIGNHTWDHPSLPPLPAAKIASQFSTTNAVLGRRATCMRPPGGATSPRVAALAAKQGMNVMLWNVDTRDWSRPGPARITTAATTPPVRGGAPIILFHDGGGDRSQTLAALPGVLDSLTRAGYRFETLPACR